MQGKVIYYVSLPKPIMFILEWKLKNRHLRMDETIQIQTMLMQALYLTRYGRNLQKNLKFMESEVQEFQPHDLLIEVKAAALNPADYKIMYGWARILFHPQLPVPVGFDLAGIVIGKGTEVKDFDINGEVYSKVPWDQMGAVATHILVKSDMVALKPKNLSFSEAAGIPLVACTVIQSFEVAQITKGTKILIHAGSGGIGTFAIQYAKYLGAYVYTTTSTGNVDWVKRLGADIVIDYKKYDYRKIVKDVDVVYDTLGGKYTRQALKVVKSGGKIISVAG